MKTNVIFCAYIKAAYLYAIVVFFQRALPIKRDTEYFECAMRDRHFLAYVHFITRVIVVCDF